ncbi:hypothetical protein JB92DRAFT_3100486 [Gautieria morchelliformis]|nr:hypothetical protein JB92DRAFT_3100486 [Gautieria morchelliformis]
MQRKAIETMVAAGLSTEEIQEYLDDPDADAADSEDGGDSIEYVNGLQVQIEDELPSPAVYTHCHIFHLSLENLAEAVWAHSELSNSEPSTHFPAPQHTKATSCNEMAHELNVDDEDISCPANRANKQLHHEITDTNAQTSQHLDIHQRECAVPSGNKYPHTLNSLEPGQAKQKNNERDTHVDFHQRQKTTLTGFLCTSDHLLQALKVTRLWFTFPDKSLLPPVCTVGTLVNETHSGIFNGDRLLFTTCYFN